MGEAIKTVWTNPLVQQVWNLRDNVTSGPGGGFHIIESIKYYMDDVMRISQVG